MLSASPPRSHAQTPSASLRTAVAGTAISSATGRSRSAPSSRATAGMINLATPLAWPLLSSPHQGTRAAGASRCPRESGRRRLRRHHHHLRGCSTSSSILRCLPSHPDGPLFKATGPLRTARQAHHTTTSAAIPFVQAWPPQTEVGRTPRRLSALLNLACAIASPGRTQEASRWLIAAAPQTYSLSTQTWSVVQLFQVSAMQKAMWASHCETPIPTSSSTRILRVIRSKAHSIHLDMIQQSLLTASLDWQQADTHLKSSTLLGPIRCSSTL